MNGTVSTGSPVTREIPAKAKAVMIVLNANGGTLDCTFQCDESSPIAIDWGPGQLADGNSDYEIIPFNITSFTVTGDGEFNYRVMY